LFKFVARQRGERGWGAVAENSAIKLKQKQFPLRKNKRHAAVEGGSSENSMSVLRAVLGILGKEGKFDAQKPTQTGKRSNNTTEEGEIPYDPGQEGERIQSSISNQEEDSGEFDLKEG